MIALKKNLAPQKKSPTLTSLFFLLFLLVPPPSSFPIPIFGGVSPTSISLRLYTSRTHLQKFSGPAGPKGKRKKRKRGRKKKEEKENIITYNFRRPSRRAVVVVKARFWLPFPYIQLPLFNILSIHSHSLVVGVFFTSRFFFTAKRFEFGQSHLQYSHVFT